jgi:RNA polymerase sigma-70 factor, ECF subfamily
MFGPSLYNGRDDGRYDGWYDASPMAALRAAVQAIRDALDPRDAIERLSNLQPAPAGSTLPWPALPGGAIPQPGLPGSVTPPGAPAPWLAMSAADMTRTAPGLSPTRPAGEDPDTPRVTALVDAAKAGDTDAFAELYDRYLDTIFRYVYYRVGSKQLAEDLTSETFLRALRRIGSFTWQGRDFGAWLITIARNLVADHFKSGRFRLEVTTGEMVDADQVQEGPEGMVMDAFTNEALIEAVKRLNPQQQECLVLRFLQGLSVAETAKIMGKNEGAIKTLQYRAVRTLAQLLPEDVR